MSFFRRVPRLHIPSTRITKRNLATTNSSVPNPANLTPTFTQKPPIWARFAWPIIIANAVLMGSAIDITWNHWATLVKDLEDLAEKNKQDVAAKKASTLTTPVATAQKNEKEGRHWEPRPIWQRAAFCGIYALGWAISTAYLLKYRQTFVTSLRFFQSPKEIPLSAATTITTGTTTAVLESTKPNVRRLIHITTTSNSKGVTLPLSGLNIQDGRNETEMVIRTRNVTDPQEQNNQGKRKRRAYWYLSLTDAVVDGGRYGVETARERLLNGWNGTRITEKKDKWSGGWRSGPMMRS